jgi:hypothetical protein
MIVKPDAAPGHANGVRWRSALMAAAIILCGPCAAAASSAVTPWWTHAVNLPMDFLFGNLTQLDASAFKKQADDAELKLDGQTPVFFFSSHDHSRQWSSFGDGSRNDQIAKLTATLTITLHGTALLYYGEEIGMRDMPALRGGAYLALESANPNVFAFARETNRGEGALIVLNTSAQAQQAIITAWPRRSPRYGRVLLASPAATTPKASEVRVAPFGVLMIAYQQISTARTPATGQ